MNIDYDALITELDEGPWEMSKWESDFLASLIDSPGGLTEKQKAVLDDMAKKYL